MIKKTLKSLNLTTKRNKLLNSMLASIKHQSKVDKMSHKELADYLIQNIWADLDWESEKCAVLDRVIEILFKISEEKIVNNDPPQDVSFKNYGNLDGKSYKNQWIE